MNSNSVAEMAGIQYRRIEGLNLSEFGLDLELFNVVSSLDGVQDVETIAKVYDYDLDDLCSRIARLLDMGVVEALHGENKYASKDLIDQLIMQLSTSVGPVAGLLIDDTAAAMGYGRHSFPIRRLEELIERLSENIDDNDKAAAFKQSMNIVTVARR